MAIAVAVAARRGSAALDPAPAAAVRRARPRRGGRRGAARVRSTPSRAAASRACCSSSIAPAARARQQRCAAPRWTMPWLALASLLGADGRRAVLRLPGVAGAAPGRRGWRSAVILRVDSSSPVPPYEQIRAQVGAMVDAGVLAPGARLPSIRQLAGDLGLAGGTVARAYRELEQEGVVATRGRHGTVVAERSARRARGGGRPGCAAGPRRLGAGHRRAPVGHGPRRRPRRRAGRLRPPRPATGRRGAMT